MVRKRRIRVGIWDRLQNVDSGGYTSVRWRLLSQPLNNCCPPSDVQWWWWWSSHPSDYLWSLTLLSFSDRSGPPSISQWGGKHRLSTAETVAETAEAASVCCRTQNKAGYHAAVTQPRPLRTLNNHQLHDFNSTKTYTPRNQS